VYTQEYISTMAQKQYIMAIIHLPMEIGPDATVEPLKDHIQLAFDVCTELPPKTDAANYDFLFQNVDFYLSKTGKKESGGDMVLAVQPTEIQKRTKTGNRNTTFKNKALFMRRTVSNR